MIRNIRLQDVPEVLEIGRLQFGDGFITEASLKEPVCLVYEEGGRVVAFATACVCRVEQINQKLEGLFPAEPVGFLCNIGVHPDYLGRGIASRLTEARIHRLSHACNRIIATAWKENGKVNVGNILLRHGFNLITEIPAFWAGTACKTCGDAECVCPAVIFCRESLTSLREA